MALSMLEKQRDAILDAIINTAAGQWRVLLVDEESRRLIYGVLKDDDILKHRIISIEQIENRREPNPEIPAVYIVSALPYVVDVIMADMSRRKYGAFHLLWTSILPPNLRKRLETSTNFREMMASFRVLNIDFFPREARLVTLKNPHSFPILYHPNCSSLVKQHISDVAQRIMSLCIMLNEYPTIRYYIPKDPSPVHESHVLASYIASAVQNELDVYAQYHHDFVANSNMPKGTLIITDRSMDLAAPFVHEFTYQAMAHDLLPITDGEKVTYRTIIREGRPDQEELDAEITEKDPVWLQTRHLHMKDTIEKLMSDFQTFLNRNPNAKDGATTNLDDIKDMLAGLPEFQEKKQAYSLHLTMAQNCMNSFEKQKLPELAVVEQTLATGVDEDYRKPKNVADQFIRMLDEEAVIPSDRLRLIALYVLYKQGVVPADVNKLLLHAQLPPQDQTIVQNLELLGARIIKQLKDKDIRPQTPLFPRKAPVGNTQEEVLISRFEPSMKTMLEETVRGTLDPILFPFVRPDQAPLPAEITATQSSASLRSAKPTWAWASSSTSIARPRERIIVFMAGGATYSEARACYEVGDKLNRDVVLMTSHMTTPLQFLGQLADLTADRRRLNLPPDRPAKRAPDHLFEEPKPQPPPMTMERPVRSQAQPKPHEHRKPQQGLGLPAAPTDRMAAMNLNGGGNDRYGDSSSKLKKEKDEKKKKHGFFR